MHVPALATEVSRFLLRPRLGKIGEAYVKAVYRFAEAHHIPVVHFKKGEKKEQTARPYLEAAAQ